MPRRKRQSARREPDALDVMNAYVAAQGHGCAGVRDDLRDVDYLYGVFLRAGAREGSWAHEAFVAGSPRPCETLERGVDAFGDPIPVLSCGTACLFGGDSDD
jgi:hypothetical protein